MAVLLLMPLLAAAAPPPDPSTLARLTSAEWNRFRVVTSSAQYELSTMDADADGVGLAAARRPGRLQARDPVLDGPRRVSWADIERIDGGHTRFSGGRFAAGLLLGTLTGAAVVGMYWAIDPDAGLDQAGVLLAVPIGTIVGGVAGASMHPTRWQRIYP